MKTYLFEFIEKKCEEAGFFVNRLSDMADISDSVIQALRNGRTRLKPGTKQKLAAALKCSIGDIQDAIRRSDEILENGEVLKRHLPEEPVEIPEPEPQCPYDDPVEEPAAGPQDKPRIPEKEMPEKIGPKICVLSKVVPMDSPVDPELAKTVIQTVQQAVSAEGNQAIAETVKAISGDNVNHPAHYTQGAVECIEAIKASMTAQQFLGYLKGNAMKYMWRFQFKGGVEDLKKARWYLDRMIAEVDR